MVINYPDNSNSLIIQYHRVREGPNWIMVYYKNIASPCLTVKEVRQRFGSAKFTESCKKVCEWVQEQINTYDKVEEEGRADTSFASEAMEEKTRMVI